MTNVLSTFNNLIKTNIVNKKSKFNIKNNYINKHSKNKLIKLKKLNLINLRKNNKKISIELKFFENKFIFKNINKWK
jgi:hypothetical protein